MEARDVLVTGGTGRLGRRVVDLLRAEGIEPLGSPVNKHACIRSGTV